MTFAEWVGNTINGVRRNGWDGVRNAANQLRLGAFRRLDWFSDGVGIYERDWDVLVVLDGCRYDLMEEVYDDYDCLESFEAVESLGSSSSEWMRRNFTEKYREVVERTVHVTGNPNSRRSIPVSDFAVLDEVWEYEWDDELRTIFPNPITDRAIALHREHDPDRMLVHYMQPHHPFVENPIGDGFGESDPWTHLKRGEVDYDTVWQRYRRNLEFVLDQLPLLLNNIDADDVVVTADHGNLLGEHGLYGHPAKIALSELRTIPWCEATAEDTGEYEPTVDPTVDPATNIVEQRLADLGYR